MTRGKSLHFPHDANGAHVPDDGDGDGDGDGNDVGDGDGDSAEDGDGGDYVQVAGENNFF